MKLLFAETAGEFQKVVRGVRLGPFSLSFPDGCTPFASCSKGQVLPVNAKGRCLQAFEFSTIDAKKSWELLHTLRRGRTEAEDGSPAVLLELREICRQNFGYREITEKNRCHRQVVRGAA